MKKKNINEIHTFIKNRIKTTYPSKSKEWVTLQFELYKEIDSLLSEILNELNSEIEN